MEHKKQRIIQIVAISLTAVVIAVAVGLVFMFTKKDETPLNSYSREIPYRILPYTKHFTEKMLRQLLPMQRML